jgi:hypothetical protein
MVFCAAVDTVFRKRTRAEARDYMRNLVAQEAQENQTFLVLLV